MKGLKNFAKSAKDFVIAASAVIIVGEKTFDLAKKGYNAITKKKGDKKLDEAA